MLDFNTISEFSRLHCLTICVFLVPANLLTTSLTIILTGLRRPQAQVWRAVGFASVWALVMLIHVLTWFMIGTVMALTYILLLLALTCLSINLWALTHRSSMIRLTTL